MKVWSVMYLLIWIAFAQFLIIIFLPSVSSTYYLHGLIGLVVVAVAMYAWSGVRKTACPDRIKRISKATAILSVVQGLLGVILFAGVMMNFGSTFQTIILFLHVVNALAIITQAASSATAYDMWEEKEFLKETPVSLGKS
jgi:heme A synthase